jgi:hypothetical protein
MPCQFPNTMHWTCNLPSHFNCNDFHRSTYVGIFLQVYNINYMSHMPEQKTRHPPESKWQHNQSHDLYSHAVRIQPTFPSCCWYSSKYRIAVRLWTSTYRCRIYHLWSSFCEMLTTGENSQSHHHTISNPTPLSQNHLREVSQNFNWNCQLRLVVIMLVTSFFLDVMFTNLARIPVCTFQTNLLCPSSNFYPSTYRSQVHSRLHATSKTVMNYGS